MNTTNKKPLLVLDIEVYKNYFLVAFENVETSEQFFIEIKGRLSKLSQDQKNQLSLFLDNNETFGYNSNNYDMPLIVLAMRNYCCMELYLVSKDIIEKGLLGWQALSNKGVRWSSVTDYNHFDIQKPAPVVRTSLKVYGGRMHSEKLQSLPIDPHTELTDSDMDDIRTYCFNDLKTTIDLYNNIKDDIDLRREISKQYGVNVLSKSNPQIAEVIIQHHLFQKNSHLYFNPPSIDTRYTFQYEKPDFIQFENENTNDLLKTILNEKFGIDKKGSLVFSKDLKQTFITIGTTKYKLGVGGLHSQEKHLYLRSGEKTSIIDADVASYYPSIILNLGLYPNQLGIDFLDVYKNIVTERLEAKQKGYKAKNESLKIVINGTFGKFGSPYSFLYSPKLMLTVTMTGQLCLLMLIEKLENNDIKVVSANTDGIVCWLNKDQYEDYESICKWWQDKTKFNLEMTNYDALFSRDVNNYLAVYGDKVKGKGIFAMHQLSKNPQGDISTIAVIDFLKEGKPIENTIFECKDIRKFIFLRRVKGGGVYRGEELGNVVRWVYVKDGSPILYKENGNKVATSDGSRPVMNINLLEFPKDIDYEKYIGNSIKILKDLAINYKRLNKI